MPSKHIILYLRYFIFYGTKNNKTKYPMFKVISRWTIENAFYDICGKLCTCGEKETRIL